VPLLVGSLAYGTAYLTGLARLAPPALLLIESSVGPLANLTLWIALNAILGTLILLPSNAGEEIGWRGYLLLRLIGAGAPQPILLTGLIWGAWHLVPPVGVVGAFWHVSWVAGVLLLVSAAIGLAVYLAYSRQLEKDNQV
jgi:CAAX protease family protein